MSEKRDLWVPTLLLVAGLAVAAWDVSRGEWGLAALALLVGLAAGSSSLYLVLHRHRLRAAGAAVFGFLVLGIVSPLDLRALFPWTLVSLAVAFHARRLPPAARVACLAAAGVFGLAALLGLLGVARLHRVVPLAAAGAIACAVQVWTSRARPEPVAAPGPLIGVFGGTFDPFHRGHRAICEAALKVLDRLLVVVSARPPHKSPDGAGGGGPERTPFHHRVAMARLGVEGLPRTEVLEIENRRDGPSYTVDTLEVLSKTFPPRTRFRLLLGADSFQDFPLWHEWERILDRAELLLVARPGYDLEAPPEFEGRNTPFHRLEVTPVDVSSSELRRRIAAGEGVGDLVSPAVMAYVRDHRLYRGSAEGEQAPEGAPEGGAEPA
jgi:nicotinate-nucleotide adenylyltransferase